MTPDILDLVEGAFNCAEQPCYSTEFYRDNIQTIISSRVTSITGDVYRGIDHPNTYPPSQSYPHYLSHSLLISISILSIQL